MKIFKIIALMMGIVGAILMAETFTYKEITGVSLYVIGAILYILPNTKQDET